MATTTTVVVTANADGSVTAACAAIPTWVVFVPNEQKQIARLIFGIKELLQNAGFND